MADPQDGPENNAGANPPAPANKTPRNTPVKKAATKKAPAKRAAAKKPAADAVAKKTPARKAAAKTAPANKTPAKATPAKKAPAKAAPAKKTPAVTARKTTPMPALEPGHQSPALEAAPPHAALTARANTAQDTPAPVKSPARDAGKPVPAARPQDAGRARLPLSIGLAALGLVAMVLNRFRRG
ncbi:MAG: hypothetical protein KDB56_06095 [Mycobacterium sp.]|nr:hypothetical protein [Mycobacterium sp.]